MANSFIPLPSPAGNGSGAAADTSNLGGTKTITVSSSGGVYEPIVMIEISNDGGANWSAVATFNGEGTVTLNVAAGKMRQSVSRFVDGVVPSVEIGAEAVATTLLSLAVPAGNGSGASTDVSASSPFKTIQVAGAYGGAVNIEISEDAGVTWATAMTFVRGGPEIQSAVITADFMRVTRVGVPTVGAGLPVVAMGSTSSAGGGGGGGVNVQNSGANLPANPYATLNFSGPGITASDGGGGVANIVVAATAIKNIALANSPYQILATDDYLFVDTTAGAVTLKLPDPTQFTYAKQYYLVDTQGTFGTNNVTLQPFAGESIEGLAQSRTFQTNWGGWTIVTDGTNWFVY